MNYQIGDIVRIKTLKYDRGVVRKRIVGTGYYMITILKDNREISLTYVLHTNEIEKL